MDKRFDRLPVLMRNAIITLKKLHNTPDALALPAVLGVANLAAIPHYKINPQLFGIKPLSLFLLTMLPTGMRKSTVYDEVMVGIQRFTERQQLQTESRRLEHMIDEAAYAKSLEAYKKEMMGLKMGTTVVTKGYVTPTAPILPKPLETYEYVLEKATQNGILTRLRRQPFVGMFSSEAGEFFNSHAFQGQRGDESRATDMLTCLTKLWDGQPLVKQVGREEDNMRLCNRASCMMYFLQEGTVREVLNNRLFSEQGFIHRLLITQSEYVPDRHIDDVHQHLELTRRYRAELDPFHQRIEDIISRDLQLLPDRHFELDQRILELTPAAEQLMLQFVNANLNRGVADLQYYTGYANRLTEHMLRIAGTLAVFDLKAVIDEAAILAATDLMDYFTEQRLNLEVGVTSRNADLVSAAEKLLHWMQQKSFTGTKREIRMYVRWFKALTGEEADRILEELVMDGSLVMEEITPDKGRQYVVYRVADTVLTESIDSIE